MKDIFSSGQQVVNDRDMHMVTKLPRVYINSQATSHNTALFYSFESHILCQIPEQKGKMLKMYYEERYQQFFF